MSALMGRLVLGRNSKGLDVHVCNLGQICNVLCYSRNYYIIFYVIVVYVRIGNNFVDV